MQMMPMRNEGFRMVHVVMVKRWYGWREYHGDSDGWFTTTGKRASPKLEFRLNRFRRDWQRSFWRK